MVDKETVRKVSKVARLSLTENEEEKFSKDLTGILDAFSDLSKVNTDGITPTFQPVEKCNVLRKDVTEKSLSQKDALSNSTETEKGYFKGPRAI